jgi:hypothetical protein
MKDMTRKQFLSTISKAAVAAVGVATLAACGGGDDDGSTPQPDANNAGTPDGGGTAKSCTDNGTNTAISANHGHVMTVSKEDVIAGTEKTYDIQGTAGHPHSVTLTAADFTALQGGTMAVEVSTNNAGHTHTCTVTCV